MKNDFEGHGGSYLVDPKTGEKTLVHRTEEKPDASDAPENPAGKKSKSKG
ncbi:MAG: hypothetical protein SFX19_10140 [Alphaproteobacteria bacterium]|nr:hypothetical protein [Alphaproteobacteria bacterium]